MMLQFILNSDLEGKTVLDMGCGTGVLAILAEMKGAKSVDAIDIDNWCYLNSMENVVRNNCELISVYEGAAELLEGKHYDMIIANINRNILLEDISKYSECLNPGGKLFLSGFYIEDIPAIEEECNLKGLKIEDELEQENWTALSFIKS
jgi:ribosomal protein L11 methyltransferase